MRPHEQTSNPLLQEIQGAVMKFFLGTHQPHWLSDERLRNVPLFISRRRLADRVCLPRAVTNFALDSGGFTELQMYGRWTLTAEQYAENVRRYIAFYGKKLLWVAPQDWMCEPLVINGGMAPRGVRFAGTHLSVSEHQRRTVQNFVSLRRLLGDRVIPVLQGWTITDYWRCEDLYKKAGIRLTDERVVGIGSVCRRQSTNEATTIMMSLAVSKLALHGFGFKKGGLANCHKFIASADSTAWSDTARRRAPLLGHDRPGPHRPKGHINCANCVEYALQWREELLQEIRDVA
jgi:hypothetical protein